MSDDIEDPLEESAGTAPGGISSAEALGTPAVSQEIRPVGISSSMAFGIPTVWLTYSFAPEWFNDALHEARTGTDHNARRREVLFAVCFAESYLVEWVRDAVLRTDFNRLNEFFPPGDRRGPVEKWREVPRALLAAGLIPAAPDLGRRYWENWRRLTYFRNGLVHARASRPETGDQSEDERPLPSKSDLDRLIAGWAVGVVVDLVQELHGAVRTRPPAYLVRT